MIGVESETELIALAHALAGDAHDYSSSERQLVSTRRCRPAPRLIATTRGLIRSGLDPLGDAFLEIRSRKQRRAAGAVYTPPQLVQSMFEWAAAERPPVRVVDPGCGSGRFILEAAARFPRARLLAIDTDPLATLLLRANLTIAGLKSRTRIVSGDFRDLVLPNVGGPTLFIGNPPYVRHHGIGEKWKDWFARASAECGVRASKLSGLHIHFFVKTKRLARPGDYGCYVTASEWLDVNYGRVVRNLLADGLGGTDIYLFDPQALPFTDTLTTAAVTCFRIGATNPALAMHTVEGNGGKLELGRTRMLEWNELSAASKWSTFAKPRRLHAAGSIELGELFRVHRGQVTGSNRVWIFGEASPAVPAQYLWPTVTRAKELIGAGPALTESRMLRRVIDLPADLGSLKPEDLIEIERFLNWARANGAETGFVAQHRKAWWSVELRAAAPILCTYMARRPPTFVRNLCGARHLNIAHGLYPRSHLTSSILDAITEQLRQNRSTEGGRTYAGGLIKFEPKEIERLRILRPEGF